MTDSLSNGGVWLFGTKHAFSQKSEPSSDYST
jgi:hypothetical protein